MDLAKVQIHVKNLLSSIPLLWTLPFRLSRSSARVNANFMFFLAFSVVFITYFLLSVSLFSCLFYSLISQKWYKMRSLAFVLKSGDFQLNSQYQRYGIRETKAHKPHEQHNIWLWGILFRQHEHYSLSITYLSCVISSVLILFFRIHRTYKHTLKREKEKEWTNSKYIGKKNYKNHKINNRMQNKNKCPSTTHINSMVELSLVESHVK